MFITFFNYQLYIIGFFVTSIYKIMANVLKILLRVELLELKMLELHQSCK